MSEWKTCKLGNVAKTNLSTINKGYPHQKIEYLDTGSITCGVIESLQPYVLSESPSRAKRIVSHEDIIYSTVRPIQRHYGFIKNPKENLIVSTGFTVITCNKDKIEPKFLYYAISSDETTEILDVIAEASTSTYPSLKPSDIENLEIQIPPLAEQKAIGEVLSSLDDKIDLLHRQNKTVEMLAATLFRHHFIDNASDDWEEIAITNLFEVRDGTHDSPKNQENGKKLITSKHLKTNYVDAENANFISIEDFDAVNKRSKVETKDILLSMIGTIGNVYIEESEEVDYAIKNIGLLKTSQNIEWCYFVFLWLKSDLGSVFLSKNRSGSTQEYVSLGSLRSIKFNVPSIKSVLDFNNKIKINFQKIKTNQEQIRTLEKLRDTLLPKLISGDVRVQYQEVV